MAVKALLSFLVVASVVGILAGIGLVVRSSTRGRPTQGGITMIAVAAVVAAVAGTLNAGLHLVQPQEVAVVFRQTNSGINALLEPLQPGLTWRIPFVDQVIRYSTAQRNVTMEGDQGEAGGQGAVRAISNDGQAIAVDVTVIYRIDATRINEIHRDWQSSFEQGYVIPQTRSEVRNAISNFGAEDIYSGGRAELEALIFSELEEALQREGFLLNDILIRNIGFSPEFTEAIEQKQIAEQEAQRAVFRVQQAEQEAEQARVEAQGRADANVIAARGEAEAIVVRAEAERDALEAINSVLSLNPNLIQWQYVNNLSDQVNLVVVPSNTPFLFDTEALLANNPPTAPVTDPRPAPEPEAEAAPPAQ